MTLHQSDYFKGLSLSYIGKQNQKSIFEVYDWNVFSLQKSVNVGPKCVCLILGMSSTENKIQV
jgi:hypothetical protein